MIQRTCAHRSDQCWSKIDGGTYTVDGQVVLIYKIQSYGSECEISLPHKDCTARPGQSCSVFDRYDVEKSNWSKLLRCGDADQSLPVRSAAACKVDGKDVKQDIWGMVSLLIC